jgi:23S rRNA-/tRNA-specific pseudouridylate synthase
VSHAEHSTASATSSALAGQAARKNAPLDSFEIVHRIGEGTHGRVFLAKTKAGSMSPSKP